MIHFQAPDGNSTEFVSVCDEQHTVGELTKKWFQVSAGETHPHSNCDLCEFDAGRQSNRLDYFYTRGLLKAKG